MREQLQKQQENSMKKNFLPALFTAVSKYVKRRY